MKITIDTKEDSHTEIKRVITMLTSLVGEQPVTNEPGVFDNAEPETSGAFANMFGDDNPPPEPEPEKPAEPADDFPQILEYR